MVRKKTSKKYDHITATIEPYVKDALVAFRDDPKNAVKINGSKEKPAKSHIIQDALIQYLTKYLQEAKAECLNIPLAQ